ncbi:DUF4249 domain-containing protein [Pseudochryseolinea flava]|uniref:DUF4249 domain-containing protein n=1 Tax=Pseudochryseolinea flava TaxID=2059302 RepID=UPI001401DB1E|nr:DUF4249 domain-containing protein [Pseudochryseolinea flava]
MKNKNGYIAFSGIALLLVMAIACMPDPLPVKGLPTVKQQIVVSTQIIPDESLVVLLTKSFSALDADSDTDPEELLNEIGVNDAQVTVSGPAGTYRLNFLRFGFYGGINIPFEPGETYTLTVKSLSLGDVQATTTVQSQITFDQIDASLYFNGFDDTLAQVTYQFNDPPNKNYYMINVQEVEQEDIIQNAINPNAYTKIMTDEDFQGQNFGETFRVFPREYEPGDTIAVTLSNISSEYYDFIEKRIDNRYSFIEFLGEPVNYPSNVVGGKGFFNLYIPDIRFFVLEE